MDATKLRAWYAHRQGLDGALEGKRCAEILNRIGWARSVGGDGPYLTLFSRAAISREQVDGDVANQLIHELPSARACTYVLPQSDFALGLTVGRRFGGSDWKTAEKLGVSRKEIDKLCEAVVAALEKGPLDPEGLRGAVGKAVRNLGAEGQKKGLTSTLPVALGELQLAGEIRRVPSNGRLDQQRYRYSVWRPNPLSTVELSEEEAFTELARRFFTWTGPATIAEFQWFSGLGVKAAKAAVEQLNLEQTDSDEGKWMFPADHAELRSFQTPREPRYALISPIDSLLLLRRDLKGALDPRDAERELYVEKGTKALGGLADLPSHAIVDRGRVVGVWEYDTATESIAWVSFIKTNQELQQAVERTERYVRDQLGDARCFSLDSPKSRAPRVSFLRQSMAKQARA
jgi:hypothetical protein